MRIDTTLALRAALVQAAGVLVLGLATGLTLSHAFFEDWGWVVGPLAWMIAAGVTVSVLHLPLWPGLLGAVVAGIPSGVATLVGLHWLGAVLAIVIFALWCGGLAERRAAGPTAEAT